MKRLIAIAVCIFLAGCGDHDRIGAAEAQSTSASVSTSAAAAPPSNADPCSLVTPQDMGTMFGEIKEGPSPSSGLRNERQCNYTNMAGSWIKLSLYGGSERWEWDRGITNAQNPREVGGLGDEAFAIRRGTDAVVYVRKGESILELSCSCGADTAEAIARVATTKL